MKKSNSVKERWVLVANGQVPSVSPNPSRSDDGGQINKYNKDYVNNEAVEDASEKSSNYSEKESDSDWEGDSDDEFKKASKKPWPKKVVRKKGTAGRQRAAVSASIVNPDANESELSAYEKLRNDNIKARESELAALMADIRSFNNDSGFKANEYKPKKTKRTFDKAFLRSGNLEQVISPSTVGTTPTPTPVTPPPTADRMRRRISTLTTPSPSKMRMSTLTPATPPPTAARKRTSTLTTPSPSLMRMSTPTPATPPPTAARRRTRTPTLTSPSSSRMITPTQATPPPRMWTPPATSTRLPARLAGLNLTVTRSPYLPKPPQNQITVAEVAARLPSTISVFKSGDNTAMDLKEEKVEVITIE